MSDYAEAETTETTIELESALLDRTITMVETELPGLAYVAGATRENGVQVQKIDYRAELELTQPSVVSDTRGVADLDSFKAELTRKAMTDATTLWASPKSSMVMAVYDDHTSLTPGRRQDRLVLTLQQDEEWAAWHKLSGQQLGQEEFGDAVEELLHTVIRPDQADLMEVIESIRITTGSTFESGVRRSDGQQTLSYKEDQTASAGRAQQLEIPQTIRLKVKPFEGVNQWYELEAWFRTRVVGGQLRLSIKLKPSRPILLAAWEDLRADVAEFASRPVLGTI